MLQTSDMLIVFTRAIIIYVFLLISMRLMGKKQLGELQPFEFATTLIAAELACIPMSDTQVPVVYGLVPIFTLFVLEFIVTKLVKHSIKLRRLINGKPVIIITPDGIDYNALNRLDMTINDIFEAIRSKDYISPSQIQYAIIETNGDISVIPKASDKNVTLSDMQIQQEEDTIPYSLICEGKLMKENMNSMPFDEKKLTEIIDNHNLKLKEVLLLSINTKGEYYLQGKKSKAVTGIIEEIAQ